MLMHLPFWDIEVYTGGFKAIVTTAVGTSVWIKAFSKTVFAIKQQQYKENTKFI
jgi:hypothetical protein